ncbi:MAG: hypothetical protein AB1Z98_36085 [Nannocystaceae bacterium]
MTIKPRTTGLAAGLAVLTLTAVACEPPDPADVAATEEAFSTAIQQRIGSYLAQTYGTDAPSNACQEGEVICRGAGAFQDPLVCHQCDIVCKGNGSETAWTTDDPSNCAQQKRKRKFNTTFKVTGLSFVAEATATVETEVAFWATSMTKAALGAPIADASGTNPNPWINWVAVYSARFEALGKVKVSWGNVGAASAGSGEIETSYEDAIAGIRRCESVPGGQSCGPILPPIEEPVPDDEPPGEEPPGDEPPGEPS